MALNLSDNARNRLNGSKFHRGLLAGAIAVSMSFPPFHARGKEKARRRREGATFSTSSHSFIQRRGRPRDRYRDCCHRAPFLRKLTDDRWRKRRRRGRKELACRFHCDVLSRLLSSFYLSTVLLLRIVRRRHYNIRERGYSALP